MNRRVFEPRPDNTTAHRKQAIRLALVMLAAGYLALWYLKNSPAPPPQPATQMPVNVKGKHAQ